MDYYFLLVVDKKKYHITKGYKTYNDLHTDWNLEILNSMLKSGKKLALLSSWYKEPKNKDYLQPLSLWNVNGWAAGTIPAEDLLEKIDF